MGMNDANRRLAGILTADVVGYSAMVGWDEPGTLARVRTLHTDLIEPMAATYGGRLFKTTGDGFLAAFASAVQALRCAIVIQERLNSESDGLRLRVGVHQGEVVAEGDDLLGDGVIIAARLEPLAEPGGICISGRVREDAAGKMALEVDDLGTPELKNIAAKVQVFRVRLGMPERPALPLPDKPSIAVLAFTNMSGDVEQEYFSDGIADDIITELSRIRWLFVIARNSSFAYKGNAIDAKRLGRELGVRYVLEGSVRRGGERVRINAQLIDAETGNHIWAERYDRALTDVFAVQDEISDAVATAVGPAVSDAEMHRAMRRPPTLLGAWELYQQGMWHLRKVDATANEKARCLFEHAIERDPMFAAAYVGLSLTFLRAGSVYLTIPMDEAARLTSMHVRKAVDLDAGNMDAQAILAGSLSLQGDMDNAFEAARQILAINPNCAQAHWCMGGVLILTGRTAEGRQALRSFERLSPHDASIAGAHRWIVTSYYLERDYERCVEAARRQLSAHPDYAPTRRWMAAALGQLGRTEEARAALEQLIAQSPGELDAYARNRRPWIRPEDHEHMLDGLRKAGWQG
jgi:adenylate cyclase